MVKETSAAKKVNITATASKVDGTKHKNKDNSNRLFSAKYSGIIHKILSAKQKSGSSMTTQKSKPTGKISWLKREDGDSP